MSNCRKGDKCTCFELSISKKYDCPNFSYNPAPDNAYTLGNTRLYTIQQAIPLVVKKIMECEDLQVYKKVSETYWDAQLASADEVIRIIENGK